MTGILKFIAKYHFFILFVILEFIAVTFVVQDDELKRGIVTNSSNSVTGFFLKKKSNLTYYFNLKSENQKLVEENAKLRVIDNTFLEIITNRRDSVVDSTFNQQFDFCIAQVVNNSVNKVKNYITLNKGRKHGIEPDMGVIDSKGVLGIVCEVSDNYASVVSVLNINLGISARLKNNNYFGSIAWDGKDYRTVVLKEIPAHVEVKVGDTIVTSGYSAVFPKNIMIGTIEKYRIVKGENFYDIHVKLASNFKNLSNVYVIGNLMKEEQLKLENEAIDD